MSQPSPDTRWSNLNPQQRCGYACVWCGDHTGEMVPVGHSATTGSQVFACVGSCAGHLQATVIIEEALGHTAPIDVQAARRRYELARLRHRMAAELDAIEATT